MHERDDLARELAAIELAQRELEILYEQYFAGVETRAPLKGREEVARRLRRFANRRIMQTDLRFRYQNLATRHHSYAGYWDRIQRLMDEGRYVRQAHQGPPLPSPPGPASAGDETDTIYRQLLAAYRSCRPDAPPPERSQVTAFLERQKEKIRERFGDRPVEFRVVSEEGRPKIKVRAKG